MLCYAATRGAASRRYGAPLLIEAYKHNTFFDFAGNLIGMLVIFSFLIPLSTMLRALVLEKESKLRETLLMMGATLPAYYLSLLLSYMATFSAIALVAAAEFSFGGCFTHSAFSLVAIYAMLCYAMLCYAVLCYAMLCCAVLCYAMLCYAMLCCAVLCYAVLCYAMLC
jgi:hypothetical protein